MFLRQKVPWTTQPPAGAQIDWNNRLSNGLRFAATANSGLVNIVTGQRAMNAGIIPVTVGATGRRFDPGGSAAAEFAPNGLDAGGGNSLTLLAIWRANDSQYMSADSVRVLLSNRTAGNSGWMWGRASAVGGGADGNLTSQQFTINGVADYMEANPTIASFADTVVAVRIYGTNLSYWRNGAKSSPDRTVASYGAGSNLVCFGYGPYASSGYFWKDRSPLVLGWDRPLTDPELVTVMANPWQIFQP